MLQDFLKVDQTIPDHMPILDRWVEEHRSWQPLKDVTALLIQHQFGNQVPQTRALLELGLAPERLFWIDVPYSSNPQVREAIAAMSVPPDNLIVSSDYRVLAPYAPYQRRRIQQMIRKLLDAPPQRLLVLDDGAYFLEAASCFRKRLRQVGVVEQTTRGMIKMELSADVRAYAQLTTLVDVARSTPKMTLEPPFIGLAVCAALQRKLANRFDGRSKGRCLILGFGAIGTQVARFLADSLGYQNEMIHVFDTEKARADAACAQGFSRWDRNDLTTRFKLVIGCSGKASFGVHDYVYLEEDAVLASASSGTVELSREDFIELADSSDIDDIEVLRDGLNDEDLHCDLRIRLIDREVTFLNGGFPVKSAHRMPPRAKTSPRASIASPRACSGAVNSGVPMTCPGSVLSSLNSPGSW